MPFAEALLYSLNMYIKCECGGHLSIQHKIMPYLPPAIYIGICDDCHQEAKIAISIQFLTRERNKNE